MKFLQNDGLCELQGDSGPLHWSAPTAPAMIRARAAWMPHLCALYMYVAYGLQAATREWFDTRNETNYLLQDHCSSWTARMYTLVNKCTNSFDQISLVLSIRGRFAIFCPELCPSLHSRVRAWLRKTNRSTVHSAWWVDLHVKSNLFLCEVVIVLLKYWKRNWTNDCCF